MHAKEEMILLCTLIDGRDFFTHVMGKMSKTRAMPIASDKVFLELPPSVV